MHPTIKHPLVIASIILLAAALVFAWGVQHITTKMGSGTNNTSASVSAVHKLKPGETNPADSLPRTNSSLPLMGGAVASVSASGFAFVDPVTQAQVSVAVDSGSMIYRQGELKDSAAYQKEVADFHDKMLYATNDTAHTYIAPSLYQQTAIKLSDIKQGDRVSVFPSKELGVNRYQAYIVVVQN